MPVALIGYPIRNVNNQYIIMEGAIVQVENLSHKYSTSWAIRDINMEINRNGIVGLLGSNGAGKSTTMNIICGVLNQTEGTVLVNGCDIRKQQIGRASCRER